MSGDTKTTIGYKQRFSTMEVINALSGNGKLHSTLKFLGPFYSLRLCAVLDYLKNTHRFGFNVLFGQQH
jgi:mitochondrial import receptor subunit TOM40